jgi:hypothetical protein
MAEEIAFWVRLGVPPRHLFSLADGKFGVCNSYVEEKIGEQGYIRFNAAVIFYPDSRVQGFTTYSVPRSMVKKIEDYEFEKDKALAKIISKMGGGSYG